METHVTVALDNLTIHTVDTDPEYLLILGIIQNDFLERNRQMLADKIAELVCFGHCEIPMELN